MMPVRFLVLGAVASLGLAAGADAAPQNHPLAALIGDVPDTSNWPHPAATTGNPFVRSTAPAADIALRDQIAQLGKTLFWDEQLSSDNTMSCGTCHLPSAGGTDSRMGSVHANGNFGAFGVVPQAVSPFGTVDYGFLNPPSAEFDREVTPVTPPTMIGAYLFEFLFWDRRAGPDFDDMFGNPLPQFAQFGALEDLAVEPPLSPVEMGHEALDWQSGFIQAKLDPAFPLALVDPNTIPPDIQWITGMGAPYAKIFDIVFNGHPEPMLGSVSGVTRERFAAAIAHYHRTLIPDQAPIDLGTMTRDQMYGFQIMDRSGCFRCHSASGAPQFGPNGLLVDPFDNLFSDGEFHSINIAVPRKTPTLRNLGLHVKFTSTGHGGDGITRVFVNNQSDLIDFYEQEFPPLGTGPLTPLERQQFADFLFNALTDPRVAAETFPFDRPQLYSELHPFEGNEYGLGTPPIGSPIVPNIIANSPPLILPNGGIDWFKVGVGDAPPNAVAWLLIDPAPAANHPLWVAGPAVILPTNGINAQGIGTVQQPVALAPAMLGVPFYAQWMIYDGVSRVFSNAAEFIPFHW
ncbi:MAG: cytochrome-c peroxidase [Planctomycetes bacterium]|nr:cytochrome-c peroxidase [Planctomycetota bacterium]